MEAWQRNFAKAQIRYALNGSGNGLWEGYLSHLPTSLFKFRRLCDSHLDALMRGGLYAASAKLLNDPSELRGYFEWRALYRYLHGDDPIKFVEEKCNELNIAEDMMEKFKDFTFKENLSLSYEISERFFEYFRSNVLICSFSSRIDSATLWSHYSESHTGFCVEYSTPKILLESGLAILPVLYRRNKINASKYLFRAHGTSFGTYLAINKHIDWQSECEWRIVIGGENLPDKKFVQIGAPISITVGTMFEDDKIETLLKFCSENSIPLYRAEYIRNSYTLTRRIIK